MKGMAFSLKGLFLAVSLSAGGVYALVYASPIISSIVVSTTLLVLLTALLAVACRPSPRRAFWLGFAVFGWGYLLLLETPLGETYRQKSPTHAALESAYQAIRREYDPAQFGGNIPDHAMASTIIKDVSGTPIAVIPRVVMPNERYFHPVGHYLWAWVLGAAGGLTARLMYRIQQRETSLPG